MFLLVTRDISAWKECVIDMFSIHDSCENIFNVYSKVNIVQFTTLNQAEHERDILCGLRARCSTAHSKAGAALL